VVVGSVYLVIVGLLFCSVVGRLLVATLFTGLLRLVADTFGCPGYVYVGWLRLLLLLFVVDGG